MNLPLCTTKHFQSAQKPATEPLPPLEHCRTWLTALLPPSFQENASWIHTLLHGLANHQDQGREMWCPHPLIHGACPSAGVDQPNRWLWGRASPGGCVSPALVRRKSQPSCQPGGVCRSGRARAAAELPHKLCRRLLCSTQKKMMAFCAPT